MDGNSVCLYDTILAGLFDWFMNHLMHKSFGFLTLELLVCLFSINELFIATIQRTF
jgi:hypothetical protein